MIASITMGALIFFSTRSFLCGQAMLAISQLADARGLELMRLRARSSAQNVIFRNSSGPSHQSRQYQTLHPTMPFSGESAPLREQRADVFSAQIPEAVGVLHLRWNVNVRMLLP
jgi:hypothetical protein